MGPSERGSGRPAFIYLEAEKPRAERIPRARAKTDAGEQHRVEDGHRERFLELRLERLRRQLGPGYEVTGRSERVRQEGVANCTYRVGATLWPRFGGKLDLGFGRSRFGADWLDTAPAMRLLEVMRGGEDIRRSRSRSAAVAIDAGRRREARRYARETTFSDLVPADALATNRFRGRDAGRAVPESRRDAPGRPPCVGFVRSPVARSAPLRRSRRSGRNRLDRWTVRARPPAA